MRRALPLLLLPVFSCRGEPEPLAQRFVQLDGGGSHVCGVTREGRAYCWGDGEHGQLGSGDSASSGVPLPVAGGVRFTRVDAGYGRTCGLDDEGVAWCWGEHAAAPAGPGLKALTETVRAEPLRVGGDPPPFVDLATGAFHACALTSDGEAYCWGHNLYGELGTGTHERSLEPAAVTGRAYARIVAGRGHTCALDRDGGAWCWGQNDMGQLGDGGRDGHQAPVAVAGGLRFRSLTAGAMHTCGLGLDGRAWCWGIDNMHQLGGAASDRCVANRCARRPVEVLDGHRFRSVSAGPMSACGVTDDGEAWCWGDRWTHEPGEEAARPPERAASKLELTTIAAGGFATCGITPLGETRCFGRETNPVARIAMLAVLGGFAVALLLLGWERRIVPTVVFAPAVAVVVATWVYAMVPLYLFWRELATDETGWFFILELFAVALLMFMVSALAGFLYAVARAWHRRQQIA